MSFNSSLTGIGARVRELICLAKAKEGEAGTCGVRLPGQRGDLSPLCDDTTFNEVALELFSVQFQQNPSYRTFCEARRISPASVEHWTRIPAIPTSAFKDFEVSCLPLAERTAVFHSSGTTGQRPSRHFHSPESLAVYEESLLSWFQRHCQWEFTGRRFAVLTPPPTHAPHSSLVYMFETIHRALGFCDSVFLGSIGADGAWELRLPDTVEALRASVTAKEPLLLLGTAFSFVHLLEHLQQTDIRLELPAGSSVLETGGYKGRSRAMPKADLHRLLSEWLGIPGWRIVCEYGMSELSSQAYDLVIGDERQVLTQSFRCFYFPPWARARLISPETGREVEDGQTGLIQIIDLANVYSVLAVQTEDLGIRRGAGFELLGRPALAEPRGCSLMTAGIL